MRRLVSLVSPLFVLALLAGCASPCPPSAVNGAHGKWEIVGLDFTIPKATPIPVHLGRFTYDPPDVAKISDAILSLDQYNTAQCNVIKTLASLRPQPVDRIANLADKIAASNDKILAIADALSKGPSKQSALQTVAASKPPPPAPAPDHPAPPTVYLPPQEWYATTEKRLGTLMKLVPDSTDTNAGGDAGSGKGALDVVHNHSLVVTGFESGKSSLTQLMKTQISTFFKNLAEAAPKAHILTIALVGYSDTSGAYARNIALGLSRAQAVAGYMAQIDLLSPSRMRFVSSGGVSNDFSRGRLVEIYVLSSTI